ncbi:S8 family peptidase [Mycobacterium sp. BMJ-28]
MPDLEPIVVLPAQVGEYSRKPGGGSTPKPLVPVDQALRSGLVAQLAAVRQIVADDRFGVAQGAPLAITVRDEALAKTRRPYGLLAEADLTPVAGESRGQMISRATPQNTRALAELIATRTSNRDVFAISTFESFRIFDPVRDAIAAEEADSPEQLLALARQTHRPLRVELFPWLSSRSPWNDRQTLRDYLYEVGLPIISVAGSRTRTALYLEVTEQARAEALHTLTGIRSAVLAPTYSAPGPIGPQSIRVVGGAGSAVLASPDGIQAVVGVFDSGVEPGSLDPWIQRRWQYDVGADRDTTHGTFVAGLVANSHGFNSGSDDFPRDPALLMDAQVLSVGSISEHILIDRITEVLNQAGPTGPRVWNCSFNRQTHMNPMAYSMFSHELDLLSDTHGVLIVQSAGNYDTLRTTWPPDGSAGLADGIATPAEGIRSLTVGSVSHRGGMAPRGAPASYSRRGPSFGGQQKPEVAYWSGDLATDRSLGGFGIQSLGAGDFTLESVGTSFATPIVSSIAANIWTDLLASGAVQSLRPELVKALVVHSATVANMAIDDEHRLYYGAGVPRGDSRALFDQTQSFTTIHEVQLRTGVNWEKRPFPMPACLIGPHGKMKAAAALTVSYAPLIDPAFGEECVRTCVEPSFGHYVVKEGEEKFEGKMVGSHTWERNLIDRGKWSPIKTYHRSWSNIDATGDWALKLRLTARDSSIEPLSQRAYVILTLESPDPTLPVHNDGLAAIARLRYPHSLAVDAGRLRVQS